MAVELKEFNDEENLKKKLRQKKRIRGVLIVINALLLCYFSYLVIDTIVRYAVEKNRVVNSEIIALNGRSSSKSMALYEEHISGKVDVADFALYGKYLLTDDTRVDGENMHYESAVWLVDLLSSPFLVSDSLKFTLGEKLDQQIDLFALDEGDYMLCRSFDIAESKGVCYRFTGEKLTETTVYSFPDADNHRKKITVKGKASSPALIVSVENVNLLPNGYYDFVVMGKEEDYPAFQDSAYRVRYVDTLKEAYLTNASYALCLSEEESIVSSNYVSLETEKSDRIVSSSVYGNLDADNAIRELGGYVFSAGYGVREEDTDASVAAASREIKTTGTEVRNGKMTLRIPKTTALETIENLLSIHR
mgnify:CR=1 FL=1